MKNPDADAYPVFTPRKYPAVSGRREFASDDATVVVGTVIDPDMNGELRVTVVATGIGTEVIQEMAKPMSIVKKSNGEPDYKALEQPTIIRNQVVNGGFSSPGLDEHDLDVYDIPAFLRRQAD